MTNDIVVVTEQGNPYALMPVLGLQDAAARRQAVIEYTRRMLVSGTDYGKIPGTGDKPTLLKPGAEKLASLFGLSPLFEMMEREMDWTGDAHGGEPFFYMQYRCTLTRGDIVAGQGVGSCNSWEKKYRYRTVYPNKATAEEKAAGRLETRGGRNGSYQVYVIKNADPADVVNTVDKMAQKRALVAAVLIAVNASELFTQDIEDYSDIVDGDWTPAPPAQPAPRPAPAPAKAQPTIGRVPAAREAQVPSDDTNDQAAVSESGPLPDDELTVSESEPRQFIAVAASLLETDADTVKNRLKALGYTGIPGDAAKRIAAYRRLKADVGTNEQDDLFGDDNAADRAAALATAQDKQS